MPRSSAIQAIVLMTVLSLTSTVAGQNGNADHLDPRFHNPVRIKAGDTWLGAKRLYPSPVAHDVDKDGKVDLVIGDLWGRITFAGRISEDPAALAAEKHFLAADGKQLDFSSW